MAKSSMPMHEKVLTVALIATVTFALSIPLQMPWGWTALGLVAAVVAWPTYAIVRTLESRHGRPTGD